jgi:hypothetical protein
MDNKQFCEWVKEREFFWQYPSEDGYAKCTNTVDEGVKQLEAENARLRKAIQAFVGLNTTCDVHVAKAMYLVPMESLNKLKESIEEREGGTDGETTAISGRRT